MTENLRESISARLAAGQALAAEDVERLASTRDILSLGMVADEARRARHGAQTTFVRVAELRLADSPAGTWPPGAGEVSIVGAPDPWHRALDMTAGVVQRAGATPVSAFSLADLEGMAAGQGRTLLSVLEEASSAGLEWIADVPIDQLRNIPASFEALSRAGLRAARVTLHKANGDAALDLCRVVRGLVAAGSDVRAFAPLPRALSSEPSTGYQDVKQVAIARLLLDNVPSIQIHWTLYGPKLAQVALTFGADDVDAVPATDDPSVGRRRQPGEEIRRNIRACFQTPVERNGRFEPLER